MKKKVIRIKITPGYINNLFSKSERYFVADSECPGLALKVQPLWKDKLGEEQQGKKVWVWHYRPRGKKPTRMVLGRTEHLSPDKARRKVKSLQGKHVSGKDPIEEKNKWKSEISLSDGLKEYFDSHLTRSKGFRTNTIKAIKTTFDIWILRKTKDLNVKRRYPVEELKDKKLSVITPAMIKVYHEAIGSKAPYMANRFVAYLKMFFNYAIEREWCEENPCAKFKGLYEEKPYQDALTKTERNRVYDNAVVRDERSGRLLKSHYEQHELNPVSCCLIAFQLFTGRRTRSEASLLEWSMFRRSSKKIILKQTKTSKKNKIFSFKLGPRALEILQTIQTDRLNNPESKFYFPPNDIRSKYIFPSAVYGRLNKFKKVITTPYVIDPRVTWTKLLTMAGIERHLKHYTTRHTHLSIALEEVGCAGVAMGVESGSIVLRKSLLDRFMPDSEILRGFKELEETNIRISANNIIGFPGETREDIMLTIELNRKINPDTIMCNAFRPYAGTGLRKICIEKGLIPKEERAEDNRIYGAFFNGVLTADELENIRKAFALYVSFPKSRWAEIRKAETEPILYNKLMSEFKDKQLLDRKNRHNMPGSLHENIDARELFINDPESVVV